jgi:hypothetical protein
MYCTKRATKRNIKKRYKVHNIRFENKKNERDTEFVHKSSTIVLAFVFYFDRKHIVFYPSEIVHGMLAIRLSFNAYVSTLPFSIFSSRGAITSATNNIIKTQPFNTYTAIPRILDVHLLND